MADQNPDTVTPSLGWVGLGWVGLGCFVYTLGGYALLTKTWLDAGLVLYILITIGIAGGYLTLKAERDPG